MKSVAIVGAGPSGLVAAKTLLHAYPGKFDVTVLEKSGRIGGMWAVQRGEAGDKVAPDMPTNLSRYTVAFSDLAWESVKIGYESSAEDANKGHAPNVPMFPKAWQVGEYLQTYARKYIPESVLHLESLVTSAKRVQCGSRTKWKIEWIAPRSSRPSSVLSNDSVDEATKVQLERSEHQDSFDFLIVATGFFSSPRPPDFEVSNQQATASSSSERPVHSSKFRNLSDFLPSDHQGGGNIVVVGGGMSGAEAAASAAFQISSAMHSPSAAPSYAGCKVYHVCSRPFYILPRYIPRETRKPDATNYQPAPSFVPLDLCMYDLSRRPGDPILPMNGRMPADKAARSHGFLQSVVGGDQSDLGSEALVHSLEERQQPAYVAISDGYDSFVRSGVIVPVRGRVSQLCTGTDSATNGKIETQGLVNVYSKCVGSGTGQKVEVRFLSSSS